MHVHLIHRGASVYSRSGNVKNCAPAVRRPTRMSFESIYSSRGSFALFLPSPSKIGGVPYNGGWCAHACVTVTAAAVPPHACELDAFAGHLSSSVSRRSRRSRRHTREQSRSRLPPFKNKKKTKQHAFELLRLCYYRAGAHRRVLRQEVRPTTKDHDGGRAGGRVAGTHAAAAGEREEGPDDDTRAGGQVGARVAPSLPPPTAVALRVSLDPRPAADPTRGQRRAWGRAACHPRGE